MRPTRPAAIAPLCVVKTRLLGLAVAAAAKKIAIVDAPQPHPREIWSSNMLPHAVPCARVSGMLARTGAAAMPPPRDLRVYGGAFERGHAGAVPVAGQNAILLLERPGRRCVCMMDGDGARWEVPRGPSTLGSGSCASSGNGGTTKTTETGMLCRGRLGARGAGTRPPDRPRALNGVHLYSPRRTPQAAGPSALLTLLAPWVGRGGRTRRQQRGSCALGSHKLWRHSVGVGCADRP